MSDLREAAEALVHEGCREWVEDKCDRCNEPAEFVLWGKLLEPEALGPRCYDHAAKHVGHDMLSRRLRRDGSYTLKLEAAIMDLRPLQRALEVEQPELTVPISYCKECDKGRKALEVSDEPCKHSLDKHEYGRIYHLTVVPTDPEATLP